MNSRKKFNIGFESEEFLSQYKPLKKFLDRMVFRKLKLAIKNFCSGMNEELLQAISPRLFRLVKGTRKVVEIKFKLLGNSWPPQIVYSSNIDSIKTIGFNYRELTAKPSWRYLFTDRLVEKTPTLLHK